MVLVIAVLALCYGNCGRISTSNVLDASTLGRSMCDARLKKIFGETYHPFLQNNCAGCHAANFANANVNVAYNVFLSKSQQQIDYNAVTPHGGNSNSRALQPQIDSFKAKYNQAYAAYEDCKVSDIGIDILLKDKNLPALANHNNTADAGWVPIEWQVDTEAQDPKKGQQLRAFFKIQVRKYMNGMTAQGIQIRRPTMTLHSGQEQVQISALKIHIDGAPNDLVTTYEYLGSLISGSTEMEVAPGSGASPLVGVFDETTKFAVELQGVAKASDSVAVEPPIIPPVDPGLNLPTTMTLAELNGSAGQNNVFFRSCVGCHSGGSPSGSLNLQDPVAAKNAAASIKARMNDAVNPMPRTGILDQRSRGVVDVWVNTGAN